EFVVSEALHALGIPTTRALSLTLLRGSKVRRERTEPGAIVLRFAQSWLRLGSFDILRARGDRVLLRTLAIYVAENVLGGWEALPGRLSDPEKPAEDEVPRRGIKADAVEGPAGAEENRFARLYREVVRRNALTVAKWQAYGFMNGVLNTDNTSVMGLSVDYGPFAFMDNFDPSYTPNHDDSLLRYSYKNQPTIIWWNLVRFGEALGELLGAGAGADDAVFVGEGVKAEQEKELVERAEKIIMQAGEEYKVTFLKEYKRLMGARLGLRTHKESDFDSLFSSLLDTMQELELDFSLFFRRLSGMKLSEIGSAQERRDIASVFFYKEGVKFVREDDARVKISEWLDGWRERVVEDWGEGGVVSEERDAERRAAMKAVNPNFIPRGWILDEVIRKVEKDGERDVLRRVMHMALHPFEDTWDEREFGGEVYKGDAEEEARWTGDVSEAVRALQCSCSS
ncbi:YdiU family protein, partial [Candidatus Bathyarchaeota archaeon]|nr:YdiU family protein [Candidatus Bathyarchaeota archaeon]